MKKHKTHLLTLLVFVFLPLYSNAQVLKNSREINRRTIEIQRLSTPPKIDGVLDEVWKDAAKTEDFYQSIPTEGVPSSEKTFVYIGYDKENIYVAFEVFDSEANKIRAFKAKRDQGSGDSVYVTLDTFNDKRTAYLLDCNAFGVQGDAYKTSNGDDWDFDIVYSSAGQIKKDGYVVEMAIPFKSLRFQKKEEQNWGIQFGRYIARKSEDCSWMPVFKDRGDELSQIGLMTGLKGVLPPHVFEVIPEATIFKNLGGKWKTDYGVNFRYGPSANYSIDLTYNPDFSQIELDPITILTNLRYPVYFPEKRPFFMERADIFSSPSIDAVHTRSIVDPLWGAKFTGKFGRTNLGLLYSQDESTSKKTDFTITKAKFDVGNDDSIGIVATNRIEDKDYNRVFGVDTEIKKDSYFFDFQGLFSADRTSDAKTEGTAFYSKIRKETGTDTAYISYKDISNDFNARTGFVSRANYRVASAYYEHRFYKDKPKFTYWAPSAYYARYYEPNGTLTDEYGEIAFYLDAPSWYFSFYFYPQSLERYEGIDYRMDGAGMEFYVCPSKYISGRITTRYGEQIHYSAPIELGNNLYMSGYVKVKPLKNLNLTTEFVKSQLNRKNSVLVLSAQTTIRETVQLQLTKKLTSRIIYDYTQFKTPTSITKEMTGSALLSYIVCPGSALYIGFNINKEATDGSNHFKTISKTIFSKLTYRFRN
ncbi:MAG TPA: DUF5916 domain-containing protein [Elusimicrobiales bacterium]|nr:DUF5916 domain-containing protein [Elusimicrobiales bacterium]